MYTNASIQGFLDRFAGVLEGSNKYPHVKLVDEVDIEAFIGIMYLRSAFGLNLFEKIVIWNHESAHDIFAATMSVCRLNFICRFITFDDKATRSD